MKQWIRLFPIPYRDLDNEKKFRKYNIIEVDCKKATDDKRPESFKVDAGSIRVLEWWDSKDGWQRRKSVVMPTLSPSMCEVYAAAQAGTKSLALIKPIGISFEWEKATGKDEAVRKACYAQLSFFNAQKNEIEAIPYAFYYAFKCSGVPACPGHRLPIIDWEIGQAYRDWRHKYKPESELLEKIKMRWLDKMCLGKADPYFFVGNMHRFQDTFMILGTFYPPAETMKKS